MLLREASLSAASPDSSLEVITLQEFNEYIDCLQSLQINLTSIIKMIGINATVKDQIEQTEALLLVCEKDLDILMNCFIDSQESKEKSALIDSFNSTIGLCNITTTEGKIKLLQALQGDYAHIKIKQNFINLKIGDLVEQKEEKGLQSLHEDNINSEGKHGEKRKRETELAGTKERKKSKTEATIATSTTSSPMTFLRTSQEGNSDRNTTNAEQTSTNAAGQQTQFNKPGGM